MRAAVVAMAMCACAPALPRDSEHAETGEYAHVIAATADAWRDAGLPWSSACDAERPRVVIAFLDDEEMRRNTGYCAGYGPICESTAALPRLERFHERAAAGCLLGTCVAGATTFEQSEPWPAGLFAPWRALIMVSDYLPDPRSTIAHEYTHALARCALGHPDGAHNDDRLWQAGGVVRTAVARLSQVAEE